MSELPVETILKRVTLLCWLVAALIVLIVALAAPVLLALALAVLFVISVVYVVFFIGRAFTLPMIQQVRVWLVPQRKAKDA